MGYPFFGEKKFLTLFSPCWQGEPKTMKSDARASCSVVFSRIELGFPVSIPLGGMSPYASLRLPAASLPFETRAAIFARRSEEVSRGDTELARGAREAVRASGPHRQVGQRARLSPENLARRLTFARQ
jgi:hypothetical protein